MMLRNLNDADTAFVSLSNICRAHYENRMLCDIVFIHSFATPSAPQQYSNATGLGGIGVICVWVRYLDATPGWYRGTSFTYLRRTPMPPGYHPDATQPSGVPTGCTLQCHPR